MKKNTYIFLGIFACMITATLLFTSINQTRTSSNVDGSSQTMTNTHPNQDINGYFEWLSARRGDAITGEINLKQYYAALEATEASRRTNSRALSLDWIELGPNNVGGRTRALLIDQDDNSTLLAGGVGGGLWKSETSGTSWFQVSGIDDFLTVSSICQAKNGDIYVGTGEGLYTNFGNGAGGLPGNGIYKSTDGGDTFVHLSATTPVANKITERWAHVNALAASPNSNRIYAGTERGLMISTDGGATWIAASSGTLTTSTITDLAVGPDGTVHASVGYLSGSIKYFRSDKNGDNFTDVDANIGYSGSRERIKFAVSPQDEDYVYCAIADGSSALGGLFKSKDGGDTWTKLGQGSGSFTPLCNAATCQGYYDLALAVDAEDKNRVILGGVELWAYTDLFGWDQLDLLIQSNANPYYVHADKHVILYNPGNPSMFFVGTDGGMFITTNNGGTFTATSREYNTVQFYSVAAGYNGWVMGGTQDNGTQFIPFLGLNDKQNAIEVNGGDGGYTEISKFNPNAFFAATPQGGLLRSANAGGSFSDFYDLDIIPDPPGGSFVTPFLLWEGVFDQIVDTIIIGKIPTPIQGPNHAEYDTIIDTVNTPAKFFVGLDNNVYMTKEATDFSLTPEWFRISKGISGVIESMAISKDGDVLYVGNNAGRIYRITNIRNAVYGLRWSCAFNFPDTTTITCFWTPDSANVITDEIALFASRNVTGLSVDPNDNAHVVMTLGNYNNTKYVYETKNGLDTVPSWTSIQGNLPAMPVYSVVIDANDGNIIYLGTEFGVWASSNGGGSWSVEIGGDMDNVPTFMIRQEHHPRYWDDPFNATYKDSFVLYIATHGRGLFSSGFDPYVEFPGIEDEETNITFSKSLQVYPNPINNEGYAGFIMEKTADVHIEIYDLQGRLVEHYEELDHIAGKFIYVIDGTKFHNGTYLIRAITENETRVAKMIILR